MLLSLLLASDSALDFPLAELGQFLKLRVNLGQPLILLDLGMQVHKFERNVILLKCTLVLAGQVTLALSVFKLPERHIKDR